MALFDVYKVSLFTHHDQRQFINTFYYEIGAIVVIDEFEEAKAIADTFISFWQAAIQGVLSQDTVLGCIKVEKVKGTNIPTFIQFFTDVQGTQVGQAMPNNLTMVIRRRHDEGGNAFRSLMHISGFRVLDTDGSFLNAAFVSGNLNTFVGLFNDQMVASASFNLAEFNPVIPHTGYVYGRKLSVTVNVGLQQLTRLDGKAWDVEGFITGPGFRIAAPSKNKGTYTATILAGQSKIDLSENGLELDTTEVMNVQQVVVPKAYFSLGSTIPQISVRQLNNRRSSHTAVVASVI